MNGEAFALFNFSLFFLQKNNFVSRAVCGHTHLRLLKMMSLSLSLFFCVVFVFFVLSIIIMFEFTSTFSTDSGGFLVFGEAFNHTL